MNNEGSHDASTWGSLWVRTSSRLQELDNCNEAAGNGVAVVRGITTYCDTEVDGGGWELFLHTDNGQIPGPLTESGGDFDPQRRQGEANTALADVLAGYPAGNVEVAIAWSSSAQHKPRGLSSYDAAVGFFLPIAEDGGQTFAPSPNGNCENDGYAPVEVSCLSGDCGDIVGTMYTGATNFGACYGRAYGLVRSNNGNAQCDWGPDSQDFTAIYVSHIGDGNCRYVYEHGTGNMHQPEVMTMWVRRVDPVDCRGVEFGDAVEDECGVCDGDGSSCARRVPSCTAARSSGLYLIDGETVYCEADVDGGGWSLVASFVNTDDTVHWSGDGHYDAWTDASTFGQANDYQTSDYKSSLFSTLLGNDIMVRDEFGWVSYHDVLGGGSMGTLLSSYSECQTTPLVPPGDARVHGSSAIWRDGGMLAFYPGDQNSADHCALSGGHSDSTVLAIAAAGCGSMGAGQVGTNYVAHTVGRDWHASLNAETTCNCCDTCGAWHDVCTATSDSHMNNEGSHDASTWGSLWVRPSVAGGGDDCVNTPWFHDASGYTCSQWAGYDCTTADADGDAGWGFSPEEKQELLENCRRDCHVCDTGTALCADTPGFVDAKGYSCSDWRGPYNCGDAESEYAFSHDEAEELRANCRRGCGLCDSGTETCANTPGFVDEKGWVCADWAGYDCAAAEAEYAFSQEGAEALRANCRAECGSC